MPSLAFACPASGEEFVSGIHTDEQSLARVGQLPVRLQCPICGRTHQLIAKNGHLKEVDAVGSPALFTPEVYTAF